MSQATEVCFTKADKRTGTVGLEPTTTRLTAECSTDWAMLQEKIKQRYHHDGSTTVSGEVIMKKLLEVLFNALKTMSNINAL